MVEVAGHWLPRMEVAGIPSTTAKSVMEAAGTWENWCRAWTAEGNRHQAAGEEALSLGRHVTAGEAFARASLFYHFAQFMFFDDIAQKSAAAHAKREAYARALPMLDPPGELLSISFEGGVIRAALRKPAHGATSHPLVILIPGSDSTKEEFPALEAHFLKRGLATLSVDGPGQGEGRSLGPLRTDIGPALAAIVEHVSAVPGIAGGIALVGMAFGGHLALRAARAVPGLKAVVSINGFHYLAAMWPGFPPVYRDNMTYALGAADLEEAAERARAFTLARALPAPCPTLIIHGGKDRIFPPEEAERCAAWAGDADLMIYPDGNHVCNNIAWAYRPMAADFVAEKLI
ncbi:alpha/beta hydrolase family protein [Chelativorans salis]|uniref:Alpha/beta fold hydrolase n=1 Tax=Chelativorans salis TaxID=2978478 RepID=A0ABT2LWX2_9HYPH|nr:alpha/beta fold hydrolase [Chelativorans sp. EGI FJ00035]MCT7377689.1 alpha/beta fold hydrolase [Chelativorans sp. EGI FJ00035]